MIRQLLRRVVTLRLVTIPAAVLTALLAAFALFVAIQSGPTKTVTQARAELQQAVATATGAELVPAPDLPCQWFGVAGKVSPQLHLAGAQPSLDALVGRLIAAGWDVGRPAGGLDAADPDGHRVAAQTGAGRLEVTAVGPCVWPDGERTPGAEGAPASEPAR